MEVGFCELRWYLEQIRRRCLNPCFSGSWVLWAMIVAVICAIANVLILVLVEVGFCVLRSRCLSKARSSLNPCFSGSWVLCAKEYYDKFDTKWS